MKVAVFGLGYVGLIQGVGLARLGHDIKGIDISKEKIRELNDKIPTIYEEGLSDLLDEVVPDKFSAGLDVKDAVEDADVIFICVGTPSKKQGSMSLFQLEKVSEAIGLALKDSSKHPVIVVKSTVVPGTTQDVVIPILENTSGKRFPDDFGAAMNPEFLREGVAIDDFFNPDRIVIGSSDESSLKVLEELYSKFTCPVLKTGFKEAEMIKYASNSFLATKISFINEIGNVCKRYGIDTNTIAKGIGLDKRIAPSFLRSGIGFGGSCFPKDVNAIIYKSTEMGYNPRLLRSVLEVNRDQPLKIVELLEKHGNLQGKKIGILGLTFKEGTDDIRESPALNSIKELLMEKARLNIFDPQAMDKVKLIFPHLNFCEDGQEVIDTSEIILILTEWPEFRQLDYGDKLVIDGKNIFINHTRPNNYEGICW